jgi:hypothetical protein
LIAKINGDRSDRHDAQSAEPARAERRAGGFVLPSHRPAAVERGEPLRPTLVIAGADHIMVQPEDRDTDDWMRTVEKIARAGSMH